MKFTDSQIFFINKSIMKELEKQEKFLKYIQDLAEKENNLKTKRIYNRSIEYCIKRIEELEVLRKKINE